MAYTDDPMGPRRRALVDGLAGNTGISGAMPGGVGLPQIGGAPTKKPVAAGFTGGLIDGQFVGGNKYASADQLPGAANAPAAPAAQPAGPFQSANASVSGYLQDATRDFAPTLRGIKDEAGRKSALNQYLTSLEPEVAKRGGHISDIHGDGANVDGRRIDFFRDIEGAADPQYLDVTDQASAPQGQRGGMNPLFAGSSVAPMLQGDPSANIQNAMQQMGALGNTSRIQQLIAALSGGQQ
jgi:hypothetical protein